MLGKLLVRELDGRRLVARIVEAEAYMGVVDRASHAFGGRRTPRVEVMYGEPGRAYIYLIYGMYNCLNAVTRECGNPQAVLIRAVEPLEGLEEMARNRFGKPLEQLTKAQRRALANGPGKLCRALALDRQLNGADLCGDELWLAEGEHAEFDIVETTRVGIDYAEIARDYAWRFYIADSEFVSVR